MYDIAKKARAGMKSKAERLAGEKDRKTDSSDWTPAPDLNADVKTGMRPVSRQARKRGGKVNAKASAKKVIGEVMGEMTKKRADRMPRKAGGKVEAKGEQPLVDRYINRDLKKANEYRDGKKHDGGLKRGGRAGKLSGGALKRYTEAANEDQDWRYGMLGTLGSDLEGHLFDAKQKWKMKKREKGVDLAEEKLERKGWKRDPDSGHYEPPKDKDDKDGKARGGRAAKANGGSMTMEEMIKKNPMPKKADGFKMPNPVPLPPRRQEEKMKFKKDTDLTTQGYKKGGRTHKDGGGGVQARKERDLLADPSTKVTDAFGKPLGGGSSEGRSTSAAGTYTKPYNRPKPVAAAPAPEAKPKFGTPPLPSGRFSKSPMGPQTEAQRRGAKWSEVLKAKDKDPSRTSPEYAKVWNEANKEAIASGQFKKGGKVQKACYGGRTKKADGGMMSGDPRLGIVKPKAFEFAQNVVTPGLKKGGKVKKASGGAAAAGASAVKSLAPQNVTTSAVNTNIPKVGSGLLPVTGSGSTPGPVYDPGKYYKQKPSGGDTHNGNRPTEGDKKGFKFKGSGNEGYRSSGPYGDAGGGLSDAGQRSLSEYGGIFKKGGKVKGKRIAKQIGGALGRAVNSVASSLGQPQMGPPRTNMPTMPIGSNPATIGRFGGVGQPTMGGMINQPAPVGRDRMSPIGGGMLPPMDGRMVTQPAPVPSDRMVTQPAPVPFGGMGMRPNASAGKLGGGSTPISQPMPVGGLTNGLTASGLPLAQTNLPSNLGQAINLGAASQPYSAPAAMTNVYNGPRDASGNPTMPTAYARGGRAKRKKTEAASVVPLKILIKTGKTENTQPVAAAQTAPMPPMGMGAPPAPQGGPMGAPPSPQMPPMGPQMPGGFKRGGRISNVAKSYKDMTAGAGSGEGRLQKTDIAKRAPRKAGGKVYRSYKDMDAGAGSGMGRLEKTEIQSRKK